MKVKCILTRFYFYFYFWRIRHIWRRCYNLHHQTPFLLVGRFLIALQTAIAFSKEELCFLSLLRPCFPSSTINPAQIRRFRPRYHRSRLRWRGLHERAKRRRAILRPLGVRTDFSVPPNKVTPGLFFLLVSCNVFSNAKIWEKNSSLLWEGGGVVCGLQFMIFFSPSLSRIPFGKKNHRRN